MPDLISQEVCTSKLGNDAVTLEKIQNLTERTLLGRMATLNGDPQQVTVSNDFYCDTYNARLWMNNYDCFKSKVEFFDDCFGAVTVDGTSASQFLCGNVSGTGAAISNVSVAETGIFGIQSLDTGSTSTGRSSLFSGRGSAGAALILGQGTTKIKTKIKIPTLSTSGERYKILFGFIGDCTTSTVNDGVYFEYAEASSTSWRMCTSNDGTRTETNSTVTVGAGAWIRLEIIINSTATLANYILNGSTIGTASTNIPTTAANDPVSPVLGIWKSNGSTSRSVQTDYVGFSAELTTARAV